MEKVQQTRMIVGMNTELFKEIKKRAIEKGMTLKGWIIQAILFKIAQEDKYK